MLLLTNSFLSGLDLNAFTVPGALAPFSVWMNLTLSLIHISETTRPILVSRMQSSA